MNCLLVSSEIDLIFLSYLTLRLIWFVGNAILARPVAEAGVSTVEIYFPGGSSEYWYDIDDFRLYPGTGNFNFPVTLDKVSLR